MQQAISGLPLQDFFTFMKSYEIIQALSAQSPAVDKFISDRGGNSYLQKIKFCAFLRNYPLLPLLFFVIPNNFPSFINFRYS